MRRVALYDSLDHLTEPTGEDNRRQRQFYRAILQEGMKTQLTARQREAITYISENLQAGLRIQEIANALHTTTHLLSRTFRQDTGLGLKEYMEQMLMQKARLLLLYTNRHINKISEELGFSDPFYFSRFFKKREKLSPREYRLQRVAGKMKP